MKIANPSTTATRPAPLVQTEGAASKREATPVAITTLRRPETADAPSPKGRDATPVPTVPVEARAGQTTRLHALKRDGLPQVFAAIDLGSSSGKMLVGRTTTAGTQILLDQKIGCALGRDVDNGADIPAANMDRAIDALKRFVDLAAQHGVDVDSIPAITTAVVRNASNGGVFAQRVRDEVGLKLKVLTGEEEASIGFQGALGALLKTPGRYASIDLGGGSFQLAVGTHEGLEKGASTQIGSNIILDDWINPRVDVDGIIDDATFAFVDAQLGKNAPMPLDDDAITGRTLVATGGVSKFLRLHLGKDVISRGEIDGLRRSLGGLPISERAAAVADGKSADEQKALGVGTSDGASDYGKKLPASLSLLLHIVDQLGLDGIHVSATDARHALLHQAAAKV